MERKRWTDDDVEKLKGMAQKYPAVSIAADLGRGLSATMVKAHELRVSLRMRKKGDQPIVNPGASNGQRQGARPRTTLPVNST